MYTHILSFVTRDNNCISHFQVEEAERFWFAFVLYSVKRLSERNGENVHQGTDDRFNLCQILRVAKLKYIILNLKLHFFFVETESLILIFLVFSKKKINSLVSVDCYSIVDFFKELPQFVVKAGPLLSSMFGADWESRLEVHT